MKIKTERSVRRTKRLHKRRTRNHLKRKLKSHSDHMKVLFGEEYNPFSFAQATKVVKEKNQELKKGESK